jgi:membrane protease YdiL (CAAX protease family)
MGNLKKIGRVLLLYAKTILIGLVGEVPALLVYLFYYADENMPYRDAVVTWISYAVKIGTWAAVIGACYLSRKNRPILKCLGRKFPGNTFRYALAGLFTGFAANGICILAAWLNHDITFSYQGFRPLSFFLILLAVFIQSGGEELLCRGYLYQRIRHDLNSPAWAVLGSSILFAALHLFNPGFTLLSFINIFLVAVFFALSVYYFDSLWFAMTMHTAWNFTQNIVFGLPNSGNVMPYSVFHLEAASNSFAYDTAFGIEGTVMADIVLALLCLILFLYIRKHPKQDYNLWSDDTSRQSVNS